MFVYATSLCNKVQRTASSAMQWLQRHGGRVVDNKDTVARLSRLGASGKYPANCERDTHRMIQKMGMSLHAAIEHIPVRLVEPSTLEESVQHLPVILPHQLCLALWSKGEQYFRHCLFGKWSDEEVKAYWDHLETHSTWFGEHPAKNWPHRERLCGVMTYGDEVQAYRNSECGAVAVLGWTSELAFLNEPLCRYFAIAVWSEHHESSHTYRDTIEHVVESLKMLGDPKQSWPWKDHGYHICFTAAQGDLKWIHDRMGLHNFRANEFCSRCCCVKKADNVRDSLPHFPLDEAAFQQQDYSGVDMVASYSPLFRLPLTMERIQHDVCHSQLLGTGKTTNGYMKEIEQSFC